MNLCRVCTREAEEIGERDFFCEFCGQNIGDAVDEVGDDYESRFDDGMPHGESGMSAALRRVIDTL